MFQSSNHAMGDRARPQPTDIRRSAHCLRSSLPTLIVSDFSSAMSKIAMPVPFGSLCPAGRGAIVNAEEAGEDRCG